MNKRDSDSGVRVTKPPRPMRLNRPSVHRDWQGAEERATSVREWWQSWDVYPATVYVYSSNVHQSRYPCCEAHPSNRFGSQQIVFLGLGAVTLLGAAPVGEGRNSNTAVSMDPAAVALLGGVAVSPPKELNSFPAVDLSEIALGRLFAVLPGLAAYVGFHDPSLFGGRTPMLERWLEGWETDKGIPCQFPENKTDLTLIETYPR